MSWLRPRRDRTNLVFLPVRRVGDEVSDLGAEVFADGSAHVMDQVDQGLLQGGQERRSRKKGIHLNGTQNLVNPPEVPSFVPCPFEKKGKIPSSNLGVFLDLKTCSTKLALIKYFFHMLLDKGSVVVDTLAIWKRV